MPQVLLQEQQENLSTMKWPNNTEDSGGEIKHIFPFDFDIEEVKMEVNKATITDKQQLRIWHVRLNHLPHIKIKLLALQGGIPKRISRHPVKQP